MRTLKFAAAVVLLTIDAAPIVTVLACKFAVDALLMGLRGAAKVLDSPGSP